MKGKCNSLLIGISFIRISTGSKAQVWSLRRSKTVENTATVSSLVHVALQDSLTEWKVE